MRIDNDEGDTHSTQHTHTQAHTINSTEIKKKILQKTFTVRSRLCRRATHIFNYASPTNVLRCVEEMENNKWKRNKTSRRKLIMKRKKNCVEILRQK